MSNIFLKGDETCYYLKKKKTGKLLNISEIKKYVIEMEHIPNEVQKQDTWLEMKNKKEQNKVLPMYDIAIFHRSMSLLI